MKMQDLIENIKLEITGGVLELEIGDDILEKLVKKSLIEVQRYIDETRIVEVPFASCIDLGPYVDEKGEEHPGFEYSSITKVFRTESVGDISNNNNGISAVDPMYAQVWLAYSNGSSMYNLNSYLMNYMTYNTLLQIRNTTSTDLAFREDTYNKKLYINVSGGNPKTIAIEFVPIFKNVEDIHTPYWIDILQRLATAHTKVTLGRLRTFAKQSNALYTLDGDTILAEGQKELEELREILRVNSNLFYPVD